MPHRLSGYRVPSVCHASGVTAPPNFQSQCAIHSPCQRSGRPTNPAVTVCHLLTAMAMYPPCRLSGHRVSPAHYDDSVHPADFTVTVCHPFAMMAVWLSCRLSGHRVSPARHNGYVPALPTFWSPCITRSPRWRSTHLANFTVTVCHLLAATAVSSPANFPITMCYLLPASAMCSPSQHCSHQCQRRWRENQISDTASG